MNTGVFMETDEKLLIYSFQNLEKELPFEKLQNAIVSMENDGYYSATRIKTRKVNPLDFFVVKNGNRLENPFEISTIRMANLFGETAREFELIENNNHGEPDFKKFTLSLIHLGFFRADKPNFKRAVLRDKFDRRINKAN